MTLSWNEIKERAVKFSKDWENTCNESAEAQSFLVEFFNVFGISRRKVGTFEYKVKKLDDHDGYIDMIWKGTIVIEMKSQGKNLDKAFQQAKAYLQRLKQHELPKYILVSDFENFRLFDIEEDKETSFKLKDFVKHVQLFGFIAGYQKRTYKEEDPVNIEAAYLMGKLHDAIKDAGYTGHELEKYLVRLLFCLFAEDTTIFEKYAFQEYIENKTNEDGTDLGLHIAQIFQVLNTPPEKRQNTLDESLATFPYINGHLFEEQLSFASFNSKMRQALLECCYLDWSKISPAIFGSMFQSVMNPDERRNLGAHYTSEKNILKVIKPLFLDKLWAEYEKIKNNRKQLREFHNKIANLRFLDPACGCGNFLVITYREIRELEFAVIKQMNFIDDKVYGQQVLDVRMLFLVEVDKYFGIEYGDFATQVAQVAMWMIDHQMNMKAAWVFGKYFARIPLTKSAHIIQGNALEIDWDKLLDIDKTVEIHAKEADIIVRSDVEEPIAHYGKVKLVVEHYQIVDQSTLSDNSNSVKFNYIIGNPPFIGKKEQNISQKSDMEFIFNGIKGSGVLDYVSAWYIKAAQYLQKYNINDTNTEFKTQVAFVSTNSIAQGEQIGILWNTMFNHYKIKIHFAHRTFKWSNEAKGNAAVHVVIIGFSNFDISEKLIYEYDDIKGEPHEIKAKNINPYLIDAIELCILKRSHPICNVPKMTEGITPLDNGILSFSEDKYLEFIKQEPASKKWFKPWITGHSFINQYKQYCLWLIGIQPEEIRSMPFLAKKIKQVKEFRENSKSSQQFAKTPWLFRETTIAKQYIIIPKTSSENRKYIPMGFIEDAITSSSSLMINDAEIYHFGILTSLMHMSWVRYICGRLKSDFRYSKDIVYNNFPWPENPTDKQKDAIERAAQKVLEARAKYPNSNLAALYDPLVMPPELTKAHNELDKAVDLAYRSQSFPNETKRIEFLFELYDKYTAGLFAEKKKK